MSGKKKMEGNPDANLTSIGNYIFQKTLGEGNFAKVKLARHKITNQEVHQSTFKQLPSTMYP
jgi:MAP/microtubule affinity-regulating kinase